MIFLQAIHLNFNKIFLLIFLFLSSCNSYSIETPDYLDLNEDIRIIKNKKNDYGCTMYKPISKSGKQVPTVIYFLDKNLNVTLNSNKKDCI
tara:strand:+ start:3316 stop:3588 length:273 start_codon:yes stop_codon:yes gene_type:complete